MSDKYISEYNDRVRSEQCHFCPKRTNLQTHHIVPQRKNGSNRTENLVIVCDRCHKKLESLYDKRFYERLGLSDDKGKERTHFSCTFSACNQEAIARTNKGAWFCREHTELIIREAFNKEEGSAWDVIERTVVESTADGIVEEIKQDLIETALDEVSPHRDTTRGVKQFAAEEARRVAPYNLKSEVADQIIEEYAANPDQVRSSGGRETLDRDDWLNKF